MADEVRRALTAKLKALRGRAEQLRAEARAVTEAADRLEVARDGMTDAEEARIQELEAIGALRAER